MHEKERKEVVKCKEEKKAEEEEERTMDDDRSFTKITRGRGTVIHWLRFKNSKKIFVNGAVEKQNRRAPRRKKFSERLTRRNVSFYRPATNRASVS